MEGVLWQAILFNTVMVINISQLGNTQSLLPLR
jgi:hypothetical protein